MRMKTGFTDFAQRAPRQILTKERRFIIHDLDGVHWPESAITNGDEFYVETIAEIFADKEIFKHLSKDQIREINALSYSQTGDALLLFPDHAIGHDTSEIGLAALRQLLFEEFHIAGIKKLKDMAPQIFQRNERLIAAFEKSLSLGISHGLLTQSCIPHWGAHILGSQETLGFFVPHAMVDFQGMNFMPKSRSADPLGLAMQLLGAKPEETVFIEDSHRNFKPAKERYPQLLTFSIGSKPDFPDYVDTQAASIDIAIEAINQPHIEYAARLQREHNRAYTHDHS